MSQTSLSAGKRCRHIPALQSKLSGLAGCYVSMPSSPKTHNGPPVPGDGAIPARQPADKHFAAAERYASAAAPRSEAHSKSLAFSMPAFPMPEHQRGCASSRLSKGTDTAALIEAQSKSRSAAPHHRAGQARPRGAPEQQVLSKPVPSGANTEGGAIRSTSGGPPVNTASSRRALSSGLTNVTVTQAVGYEYASKINLRSAIGQSLTAATEWDASEQAAVPC